MSNDEVITDQSLFERVEPDCEINQDGTCGKCENNLNVNKSFTGVVEFYYLICSECGSYNQVSQLRLEEVDES